MRRRRAWKRGSSCKGLKGASLSQGVKGWRDLCYLARYEAKAVLATARLYSGGDDQVFVEPPGSDSDLTIPTC